MATHEQSPSEDHPKNRLRLQTASSYLLPTNDLAFPPTETNPSETSATWGGENEPLYFARLAGLQQLDTAAGFTYVPARQLTLPNAFVESALRWGAPITRFGLTMAPGALNGTNATNSGHRSDTHSAPNGESESEESGSEEPEIERYMN